MSTEKIIDDTGREERERAPVHFLLLEQNDSGGKLTVAQLEIYGGDLSFSLMNLKRGFEEAGFWCTQLHPLAAKILQDELGPGRIRKLDGLPKVQDIPRLIQGKDTEAA